MATKKAKAKPAEEATAETAAEPVVVAYKGFDTNWRCRGFQYEIGKTYEHDGPVKACASGFHACENPLDVFRYYEPGASRFAVVEVSGSLSRHDEDSKIAAARIAIKAELTVPEIVTKTIAWITAMCSPANAEHATGYQSASSATGYQSASSATGDLSASSATGDLSASSATGYHFSHMPEGTIHWSVSVDGGTGVGGPRVHVQPHEFEVEVPDEINIVARQIAALEKAVAFVAKKEPA